MIIQGGMGVAVSSWKLASEVAQTGHLGMVSGVALDLVAARRLQDGDPGGHVRRAAQQFPNPAVAQRLVQRYFLPDGRAAGRAYAPVARLTLQPTQEAVEHLVFSAFVEVWLAKEGHSGLVGINCLEKIQLATPATLYGAMLAGVDIVAMGAGVPSGIPALLNSLAAGLAVQFRIDVAGEESSVRYLHFDPTAALGAPAPQLVRPPFLAIISAFALAAYLARDPALCPDGFIVESPQAGGHNAPPRRPMLDASGDVVFGPKDVPDIQRIQGLGLPFWLAGSEGSPESLRKARAAGAVGIQAGTIFALSLDSGLRDDLRREALSRIASSSLRVHTDPRASPTGFPFKVAELPGTLSDNELRESRTRICDLGFLRTPYANDAGNIGYRCPAEPIRMFVRKGGDPADAVDRVCICNGLSANVGLAQVRRDGTEELPIVTLGSDFDGAHELLHSYPDGWTARQAVEWLSGETVKATGSSSS